MVLPQVISVHRPSVRLIAIRADAGASRIGGVGEGVIQKQGQTMRKPALDPKVG